MDWHLQCGSLKHLLLLTYAFDQGQIKRLFFLTFLNAIYFFTILLHKDKFIYLVAKCGSLKERKMIKPFATHKPPENGQALTGTGPATECLPGKWTEDTRKNRS